MTRGFQRISWGQQDVGSPLGNAWAPRSAGAMDVALGEFVSSAKHDHSCYSGTVSAYHTSGTTGGKTPRQGRPACNSELLEAQYRG